MISRTIRDKLDKVNQAYIEDDRELCQVLLEEVHLLLESDIPRSEQFMSEDD